MVLVEHSWEDAKELYKDDFEQLLWDIGTFRSGTNFESVTKVNIGLNESLSLLEEKLSSFTKPVMNSVTTGSISIDSDEDIMFCGPWEALAVKIFNEESSDYYNHEFGFLFDTNAYITGTFLPIIAPVSEETGRSDLRDREYAKMIKNCEAIFNQPKFESKKTELMDTQVVYSLVKVAKKYTAYYKGEKSGERLWRELIISDLHLLPKTSKVFDFWNDIWNDDDEGNLLSTLKETYQKKGISEDELLTFLQFKRRLDFFSDCSVEDYITANPYEKLILTSKQIKLIKQYNDAWKLYKKVNSNVADTLKNKDIRKKGGDKELATYNQLYNERLLHYHQILNEQLKELLIKGKSMDKANFEDQLSDTYLELKTAHFDLLLYANEPYYTQEAVRHIVGNLQMGLKLSLDNLSFFISLTENFGDYYGKLPDKLVAQKYFSSCKYLFRCCLAFEDIAKSLTFEDDTQKKKMLNRIGILKCMAWNFVKMKSEKDLQVKEKCSENMLHKAKILLEKNEENPKKKIIQNFIAISKQAMRKEAELKMIQNDLTRLLNEISRQTKSLDDFTLEENEEFFANELTKRLNEYSPFQKHLLNTCLFEEESDLKFQEKSDFTKFYRSLCLYLNNYSEDWRLYTEKKLITSQLFNKKEMHKEKNEVKSEEIKRDMLSLQLARNRKNLFKNITSNLFQLNRKTVPEVYEMTMKLKSKKKKPKDSTCINMISATLKDMRKQMIAVIFRHVDNN